MTKQNPKNLSKSKIKRIHNNLFELEKGLSRFKKYKTVIMMTLNTEEENLFNQTIDEDYYKPIKSKSVLMVITLNMKVKEINTKIYYLKNILI